MYSRISPSHFVLAASAFVLAACADAPSNGLTGPPGVALSRATGQAQRAEHFKKASPAVLALEGTVFADDDEANNRLVFGVENARTIPAVRAALAQLGVATADYEVRVTAPIYQVATLRDVWRPTIAGVQLHFGKFVCSLGFNADAGAERSFVTASHCTNKQGGVEGTQYFQPLSSVDPTVIATEVADPEYFSAKDDPICPRGKVCRYSDASRARYSGSVGSTRAIAETTGPNNGSLQVVGTFSVTAQDDAGTESPVGAIVNKVGRTSGWTQGPVTNTCVNTNVSGSRIQQLCQTFVAAGVAGGDSGSGVFVLGNKGVTLVGILWGGSGDGLTYVFSPLNQVERELGHLTATEIK